MAYETELSVQLIADHTPISLSREGLSEDGNVHGVPTKEAIYKEKRRAREEAQAPAPEGS